MIPFFQSNSLDEKYISKPADIEKFLKKAMQQQKLFQLSISGLENDTVSRIVSIDKKSRQISFQDAKHSFDDIASYADEFSVTAEVRADNKIMRFESVLLKDQNADDQFVVNYPQEIERNIKRQSPRYKPRKSITIPISLKINDQWRDVAILTDISDQGLGFIVHESNWKHVNKDLHTHLIINVENVLTFEGQIKIVHTFSVMETGNKHAGGKFINLTENAGNELKFLIQKMMDTKIISR